jgi:hypothetical protein
MLEHEPQKNLAAAHQGSARSDGCVLVRNKPALENILHHSQSIARINNVSGIAHNADGRPRIDDCP